MIYALSDEISNTGITRKLLDDGRQYCLNEARERFRIIEIVREEPYLVAKVRSDWPSKL